MTGNWGPGLAAGHWPAAKEQARTTATGRAGRPAPAQGEVTGVTRLGALGGWPASKEGSFQDELTIGVCCWQLAGLAQAGTEDGEECVGAFEYTDMNTVNAFPTITA